MTFENLLVETTPEGVAFVTVNRPKAMNALNHQTLTELAVAFDAIEADPAARALVITGAAVDGKPPEKQAFVAGADIGELKAMETALDAKRLAFFGQTVFERLEWMSKPSIAMINGFALGGGCELALACTLRTAAKTARMGLPEVSLGIIPGYGGTQRLARIAGPGVAREWVLTGDMFGAEEAHRVGVVNRVFEAADLREGTLKMVHTILSRAPLAVRMAMETIRRGQNMSQQEGAQIEVDMFGLASTTSDMREGMAAFLEKRPAKFTGR